MKWSRTGLPKECGGMGFRDLVSFNKALLAKQGWRLLKSSESLTARILKAKYYPQCSFMEAKPRAKPSFAWRSILGARDILEEGLLWRVGNGLSINIWGDRWIPIPSTYRIHSPPKVISPCSTVQELFDGEMRGWNQSLLSSIFTEEEIAAVISIPIRQTDQPDVQIWRCTNNGLFSVKSAYHLVKEMDEGEPGRIGEDQGEYSVEDLMEVRNSKCSKKIYVEGL